MSEKMKVMLRTLLTLKIEALGSSEALMHV
jgi:hypothetical protein